jgi:hypothetical protein
MQRYFWISEGTTGFWILDNMRWILPAVTIVSLAFGLLLREQRRRHLGVQNEIEIAALGLSTREVELASKLLQTLHLSVEERQELPNGRMRLSALVVAARADLSRDPMLPRCRGSENFRGVVLEMRDDVYLIHEQREAGIGTFGPKTARQAVNLEHGVRAYLRSNGGTAIDGVPIDMES